MRSPLVLTREILDVKRARARFTSSCPLQIARSIARGSLASTSKGPFRSNGPLFARSLVAPPPRSRLCSRFAASSFPRYLVQLFCRLKGHSMYIHMRTHAHACTRLFVTGESRRGCLRQQAGRRGATRASVFSPSARKLRMSRCV